MKASERVRIRDRDLRRQVFRCGGPGGQHQNKTESGVRCTHIPTGIQAESRDDRSQHRNDGIAYERLCEKILKLWMILHRTRDRKAPASFGAEVKRSYRMAGASQGVVDHETGAEHGNSRSVLDGDLGRFIAAAMRERVEAESTLSD